MSKILLDDEHRGAFLARRNGRHEPAGAGADDQHIDLAIPGDPVCRLCGWRGRERNGADSGAGRQKSSAVDRGGAIRVLLGAGG